MTVRIIVDLLQAYLVVFFVRIIFTWFPINPWSPVAKVERALAAVTDPVLVPLRRVLHPVRIGAAALDLSPLIVIFTLEILIRVVQSR